MNITIDVNVNARDLVQAIQDLLNAILPKDMSANANVINFNSAKEQNTQTPINEQVSPMPVPPTTPVPITQTVPTTASVPVQNTAPVPTQTQAPAGVPVSAPTYTREQLAVAATQLIDAGRRNDVVGLLSSFGVQALTALPKDQYGAFATQLRAMGAKL